MVITHIPPFGNWHGEKEILEKFVPTLNKAGIDLMMCGHLHRYIYQEKSDAINFPILVNHNREMIGVMANDKEIEVRITNTKGKQVKTFNYKVQN